MVGSSGPVYGGTRDGVPVGIGTDGVVEISERKIRTKSRKIMYTKCDLLNDKRVSLLRQGLVRVENSTFIHFNR